MKLRPLLTALLATCALSVFTGCATLKKVNDATLGKLRGTPVAVTTSPADATVTIDGKKAGVAPLKTSLSASKAHLLVATKEGAGRAAAIVLPAAGKDHPARLFTVSPTSGISEVARFSQSALSLELSSGGSSDAFAVMVATVVQSDALMAAGKLTKAEHAMLNKKIGELYSGK